MNGIQVVGNQVLKFAVKNSPTLLTGLGVGGLVTTVVLAIGATNKTTLLLDLEAKRRLETWPKDTIDPIFTKKEIFLLSWKQYIPTVLMGATTILCIVSANSINQRRNAALAALYSLSETAFSEYKSKVIEEIGKNKEEKVREGILQDKLTKDPVEGKQVIITGKGDTLCYDSLSGRYFKSNIEDIRRVQNDFNRDLINEMYKTLNEFYDELELEHTAMGNNMGWSTDYGMVDIDFSAKIATDGTPCIVLDYRFAPRKL